MSADKQPGVVPEPPGEGKDNEGEGEGAPSPIQGEARDNVSISGTNVSGAIVKGDNSSIIVQNIQNIQNIRGLDVEKIRDKQKRYRVGISDFVFTPDETTKEDIEAAPLPVSTGEFDRWFYGLSDYEQCFVLAMAVFYEASIDKVQEAAENLYAPLRKLEKQQNKQQEREAAEPVRRTSRTQFLKRLYIISRYDSGVDRLFWQDTDANTNSEFGTRLLLYIANEGALKFGAQEGQSFEGQLQAWVDDENEETAWRAARALGTFWYRQNKHRLYGEYIDKWARSERDIDWHRAAWSLNGVYKIDHVISRDAADDVGKHVLSKLHDWVVEARKARNNQDVNLASTAAITYTLLGRSSPQIGMNGLDTLLELSLSELEVGMNGLELPLSELEADYEVRDTLQEIYQKIQEIYQKIYEAVVFSYTDLATSGHHVREVLQHLAEYVRGACYERTRTGWGKRDERYRRELQRKWHVEAAFDIMYSITEASFSTLNNKRSVAYETTRLLPPMPTFESREGRDLILEGILIRDEKEWRNSVSTLLCAAFIERNGKLAFLLLRRWAELVLRDQSTQPDEVRRAYVSFMYELGIQVDTWCHRLREMDFPVLPITATFKQKLETWKMELRWSRQHEYIPIGLLAQEVLDKLAF
jgi:hypothetical protein